MVGVWSRFPSPDLKPLWVQRTFACRWTGSLSVGTPVPSDYWDVGHHRRYGNEESGWYYMALPGPIICYSRGISRHRRTATCWVVNRSSRLMWLLLKKLTRVPTLLSLSRVDCQCRRPRRLIPYLLADCTSLAADHISWEIMKLSPAVWVNRTFSVFKTRKMSQNSSIYFKFPCFLKAMASSLLGWYFVHILIASSICL